MFCRCCGKEINANEKYCRYCGAKIKKEIGLKTKHWEAFILFICLCALVVVGAVSIKLHDGKEATESSAYVDESMNPFTDFVEGSENNNIDKYDYFGDYNEDGIAVAQLDGYYGFVDNEGNERTDFVYEYAENFVGDLALVKKDGYYGYLNKQGDTAIGFMYDEATSFDADYHLAIVKTGNGKGVIDQIGSFIVDPHYSDIYFDSGFIVTVISQDTIGSIDKCGVYTVSGSHIIEDIYTGFYFINEKIYAKEHDSLGTLFDYYGNNLLNSASMQGALEISPPINGISIVKFIYEFDITYSFNPVHEEVTYYLYYDTELKPIIDKKLSWTTCFNKLGYAVARYSAINNLDDIDKEEALYSGYMGHEFAILRSDGTEELRLPEPDSNEEYVDVNDFYVLVHSNYRPASDMLLDRASFQRIPCYNPTMVDGTNCIIVQDKDSGLYGLYDGQYLEKECIYNDISFSEWEGLFILTRGGETEEYRPTSSVIEEYSVSNNANQSQSDYETGMPLVEMFYDDISVFEVYADDIIGRGIEILSAVGFEPQKYAVQIKLKQEKAAELENVSISYMLENVKYKAAKMEEQETTFTTIIKDGKICVAYFEDKKSAKEYADWLRDMTEK